MVIYSSATGLTILDLRPPVPTPTIVTNVNGQSALDDYVTVFETED